MQEISNYSKKLNEALTFPEKRILEVKYQSKQFGKMDGVELFSECMILMLKISVITGWVNPSGDLQTILTDQLCKKMVENYSNVNTDEVEYAFRNRNTEIKDWGKSFNLTLLDEVLQPYLEKRFEVSAMEERIKSKPMQLEEKKEITDEEMQEWVNDWKIKIKDISNPVLIPPSFYDWLDKNNILNLSKEQKIEYATVQAVSVRQYNLAEQAKSEGIHGEGQKTLNEFNLMRNEGCFTGYEVARLKELAKKIAVFDYLKSEYYATVK